MTYTITRDDAAEDARVLRAAITVAENFVDYSDAMKRLASLADSIEEQVKPVIEEPTAFGSVVRAISGEVSVGGTLWQMATGHGAHYWEDEHGCVEVWSELTDVEVLRVGLGQEPR